VQLSNQFLSQLPQPDLYLRLKTDPAQLRQRVLQRGRQFEIDRYTEAYLEAIEKALSEEWQVLQNTSATCLEYDL